MMKCFWEGWLTTWTSNMLSIPYNRSLLYMQAQRAYARVCGTGQLAKSKAHRSTQQCLCAIVRTTRAASTLAGSRKASLTMSSKASSCIGFVSFCWTSWSLETVQHPLALCPKYHLYQWRLKAPELNIFSFVSLFSLTTMPYKNMCFAIQTHIMFYIWQWHWVEKLK